MECGLECFKTAGTKSEAVQKAHSKPAKESELQLPREVSGGVSSELKGLQEDQKSGKEEANSSRNGKGRGGSNNSGKN